MFKSHQTNKLLTGMTIPVTIEAIHSKEKKMAISVSSNHPIRSQNPFRQLGINTDLVHTNSSWHFHGIFILEI